VVVDGTDLFFWTTSPSQLVHSALATATETVIVPYSGESNESVTAMALTPSLVYFAAVVGTGQSLSTITLYSTPRSGGPVSVVVALPVDAGGQQPDGIILDGSAAYVTRRPADGGVSDGMLWVVNLADATATLAQLPAGAGSQQYGARTTNVAFDGTSLYWGQGRGNSCSGALMRAAITAITTSASAETLVENIEAPLSVGLSSGSAYVGTEGDSTHAPQVLVWSP
jgi:hypothetical protein